MPGEAELREGCVNATWAEAYRLLDDSRSPWPSARWYRQVESESPERWPNASSALPRSGAER